MDGRRIRALVVDDDFDIAELVRLALTDEGHEVVIASIGSAALEEALAKPFSLEELFAVVYHHVRPG